VECIVVHFYAAEPERLQGLILSARGLVPSIRQNQSPGRSEPFNFPVTEPRLSPSRSPWLLYPPSNGLYAAPYRDKGHLGGSKLCCAGFHEHDPNTHAHPSVKHKHLGNPGVHPTWLAPSSGDCCSFSVLRWTVQGGAFAKKAAKGDGHALGSHSANSVQMQRQPSQPVATHICDQGWRSCSGTEAHTTRAQ
jgi:hypothetical protein